MNYVDYYDESSHTEYYDKNADPGVQYYYKVSAVDQAGNEGPLTIERSLLIVPDEEPEVVAKTDPVVSYKIKARLSSRPPKRA